MGFISIYIYTNTYWCVLRREWMGCWGLLGLLLVSQRIIPENSLRWAPVNWFWYWTVDARIFADQFAFTLLILTYGFCPTCSSTETRFLMVLRKEKTTIRRGVTKVCVDELSVGGYSKKTWCNLAKPIISNPQHYLQMRRKMIRRWSKGFVWTWGIPTIVVITKMMSTHDYPIGLGVPSGYLT